VIRRAHGVRGAVVVHPLTDVPGVRFAAGRVVTTAAGRPLEIRAVAPHREGLLVHFAGIEDRDAADALRGTVLTIAAEERRSLDPDEYWPDELVGCRVEDRAGRRIGVVVDVALGAAQDRLVVRLEGERRTVEIPFVGALVPVVDAAGGRIVVDLPAGLL